MSRQYNKTGKYSLGCNEVECKLCGAVCKNIRSLEAHLRTAHGFKHDNSLYEDYYIRYLKKDNEGICPVCGNPTTLHKFKYDKCCCKSCAAKYSRSYVINTRPPKDEWVKYDKLFAKQIKDGLHIDISIDSVAREFEVFKRTPGNIHAQPNQNKIVLYFQQDEFYKIEKVLFSENRDLRNKLIKNREKYLFKTAEELSDFELLRGFKISGIHQSYSHFSPLWTKWFAEKYGLTYVADPFGGWGHHMIGFAAAGCNYIYNDLSHETVEGVRRINDFLGTKYEILEGDAKDFIIPSTCDAVFMCPPYFNLEIYECGAFNSRAEYDGLMVSVLKNSMASNAKVVGVIIREDFEYLINSTFKTYEKYEVNTSKSHFSKAGKLKEYFYIWHNPIK